MTESQKPGVPRYSGHRFWLRPAYWKILFACTDFDFSYY